MVTLHLQSIWMTVSLPWDTDLTTFRNATLFLGWKPECAQIVHVKIIPIYLFIEPHLIHEQVVSQSQAFKKMVLVLSRSAEVLVDAYFKVPFANSQLINVLAVHATHRNKAHFSA